MKSKRLRRKPDLFSVMLLAVALGMGFTLAYQISIYHGTLAFPVAKQTPRVGSVGG